MTKTCVLFLAFLALLNLADQPVASAQQPTADAAADPASPTDDAQMDCQDAWWLQPFPLLRTLIDLLTQLIDLLNQADQLVNGQNPAVDPATDLTATDPTAIDPTAIDPTAIDPTAIDPTNLPSATSGLDGIPGGYGVGPVPSLR